MPTVQEEELRKVGVEPEEAIERFMGNEMLYLKYLIRFTEDENYRILSDSLAEGECRKAFEAAHTLKGVCGNLSVKGMEILLKEQVEYLRSGDIEKAKLMMPELKNAYEQVVSVLERMKNSKF